MNATDPNGAATETRKTPAIERQGVASAPGATQCIDGATDATGPLGSLAAVREFLETHQRAVRQVQAVDDIDDDFNNGWSAGELHLIRELLVRIPGNKPQ